MLEERPELTKKEHIFAGVLLEVVVLVAILLIGFGTYKAILKANDLLSNYLKYEQTGGVFLQRAEIAGTVGVAREQLRRSLNYLENDNLSTSFEYQNLKASLSYLETQQSNSPVVASIKKSIEETHDLIRRDKTIKISIALPLYGLVFVCSTFILVLSHMFIIYAQHTFELVEDSFDE